MATDKNEYRDVSHLGIQFWWNGMWVDLLSVQTNSEYDDSWTYHYWSPKCEIAWPSGKRSGHGCTYLHDMKTEPNPFGDPRRVTNDKVLLARLGWAYEPYEEGGGRWRRLTDLEIIAREAQGEKTYVGDCDRDPPGPSDSHL